MIIFLDENDAEYGALATIKVTNAVNGERSITGEIISGDAVLSRIERGWRLRFEDEYYVVTYAKPIDEGKNVQVSFDAVHQFFWDFGKSSVYDQLSDGSHTFRAYLDFIFNGSGYKYDIETSLTVKAFEKQSFGYKNRLSLFNDIITSSGVEFQVNGKVVRILAKVGTDLSTVVRKNFNLNELGIEKNIGDFVTYQKGFGAYFDEEDHSKGRLIVEYTSPLASVYGKLEADPLVDERYKQPESLLNVLKETVDNSYTISVSLDMEDLTRAGYRYTQPVAGDYIMAINETLGFKEKIRIVSFTSEYDVTGQLIKHTVTCNDIGSVKKLSASYTQTQHQAANAEVNANTAYEFANKALVSANGKNTNYYGDTFPVDNPKGTLKKGDLLFLTVGDTVKQYYWNGADWIINPVLDDVEAFKEQIADELKDVPNREEFENKISEEIANSKAEIETQIETAKTQAETNAKEYADTINQETANVAELANAAAAEIKADLVNVKNNLTSTSLVANNAQAAVDAAKQELAEVNTKVDNAKLELTQTKQDLIEVASDLNTAKQELADSVDAVNTKVDSAKAELTQAKQDLTNVASDLNTAKQDLANSVTAVNTKVDSTKAELTQTKQQLTTVADDLSKAKTDLQNAVSAVDTKATNLKNDLSQAKQDLTSQAQQLQAQANAQSELTKRVSSVEKTANGTKTTVGELSKTVAQNGKDITSVTARTKVVEDDLAGTKTTLSQVKTTADSTSQKTATLETGLNGLSAKFSNLKIGAVNLLHNSKGPFQPKNSRIDNYAVYKNTWIDMEQGKEYTLSAKGSAPFTSKHATDKEKNEICLWLVNNSDVNRIISSSTTGTDGTKFTWNDPSGKYYLRVNTYKADNSNYVEEVQIEEGNLRSTYSQNESDIEQKVAEYKQTADQNYASLSSTVQTLDGQVQSNKTTAEQTAQGFKTRIESLETYKDGESERANAYFESAKTETAKQLTAERTAIANNYVAKSTYTSDVTGIRNELSATTSTANATKTNLANYQASNDKVVASLKSSLQTTDGNVSNLQTKVEAVPGQITSAVSAVEGKIPTSVGGRNLIIRSQIQNGYIDNTGYLVSSNDHFATGFIDATNNKQFTITAPKNGGALLALFRLVKYSADKNFLGRDVVSYTQDAKTVKTITLADNVAYFKVSFDGVYKEPFKIERGNLPTDWSPAPEDTVNQISSLSSQIQQTADGMTLLATKTELNSAKNELQSGINTATNKANNAQSTANNNAQTISTHTTQISALNSGLQAKVSQTDFNTLSGRVTTAENNITAKANELSSKITSVEGKIPTSIGGRNLYALSKNSPLISQDVSDLKQDLKTGEISFKVTGRDPCFGFQASKDEAVGASRGVKIPVKTGQGIAVWLTNPLFIKNFVSYFGEDNNAVKNFKNYQANKFVIPAGELEGVSYVTFRFGLVQGTQAVGSIHSTKIKVEYGNVYTDWSPAPEDTAEQISSLSSEIKQTADGITLLATKTELSTAKSDLQSGISTATNKANNAQNKANSNAQTISTHTTQISALNTGLQAKVSQTDFNTLSGRVTTAENNITAKANELSSKITTVEGKIPTSSGGRNLAQKTSKDWSKPFTNFKGTENTCPSLYKVLTDGLVVGDTFKTRIILKYTNIVPASGKTARIRIQGSGNVTEWGSGGYNSSTWKTISGSGEVVIEHEFKITADHLKNSYWNMNFRTDWIASGSLQWKLAKAERGMFFTDWSPAPEDTAEQISNLSSEIKQTADGITLLATKTELNNAKNELQSGINTATDKANSAQNTANSAQSTANSAQNKANSNAQTISTHTTQISALNTGLSAKVSQSDFNTLSGRVTTAENNITAKANELSSKITSVEGKIPTSIGGRNLYALSKNSPLISQHVSDLKQDLKTGEISFKVTGRDPHFGAQANKGDAFGTSRGVKVPVKAGQDIAVWLTNPLFIKNFVSYFDDNDKAVKGFKNYQTNKFVIPANELEGVSYVSFRFGLVQGTQAVGSIHSTKVKVEYGNVYTDWSPAPEDTAEQISSLSSELKQTADGMTLLATKTELNTAKNELQSGINTATNKANNNAQTISTHTTQISALNTGLSAKVSQTDFNTLSGRVTTAENNIIAKANELSSKITTVEGAIEDTQSDVTKLSSEIKQTADGMTLLATKTELNTAKSDLQSGITTATNKANTAQSTADSAQSTANSAQNKANSNAQTISTHTTQISALNTGLQAKVSQTDFNTLSGRVTTAENNITAKANELSSKITSVEGKLPSGEMNLVEYGRPVDGYNRYAGAEYTTHPYYYNGAYKMYIIKNTATSEKMFAMNRFKIERNTDYTLYFKGFNSGEITHMDVWFLKRTSGSTNGFDSAQSLVSARKLSTSKAEDVSVTFNTGEYDEGYLRFDNNGTTISGTSADLYFGDVSVKKGKSNNGWSPSLAELASSQDLKTTQSELKQTKDGITLLATKTELSTAKNELQSGITTATNKANNAQSTANNNAQTISTHTTQISALNTGLQSKVSQSDFDSLSGEVDDLSSELTQTASSITASVSSVETKADNAQSTANTAVSKANAAQTGVNTLDSTTVKSSSLTINSDGIVMKAGKTTTDVANAIGSYFAVNQNAINLFSDKINVKGNMIVNGAITSDKIASKSINTSHLNGKIITADVISSNAVTANAIKAGAVTTDKMSANSINGDRIAAGTLDAAKIKAGSITASQIASGTITSNQIKAGGISSANIAAGAITGDKIAAGAIDANKIAANAITANMIRGGQLKSTNGATSFDLNAGTLTFNNDYGYIQRVTGDKIFAIQTWLGSDSNSRDWLASSFSIRKSDNSRRSGIQFQLYNDAGDKPTAFANIWADSFHLGSSKGGMIFYVDSTNSVKPNWGDIPIAQINGGLLVKDIAIGGHSKSLLNIVEELCKKANIPWV